MCTYLEYLEQELFRAIGDIRSRQTMPSESETYVASLNPPFFALVRGDRIAMVMTTSSGCFACNAATEDPGVRWDTICLTRSIARLLARW